MTNTPPSIIAIDGPAASGKSTLGLSLAQALGNLFFDTGIMYRAVTWLALKLDMDLSDEAKVSALAEQTQIDIVPASKADGRVITCSRMRDNHSKTVYSLMTDSEF